MPHHRNVCRHHYRLTGLDMTSIFWPMTLKKLAWD